MEMGKVKRQGELLIRKIEKPNEELKKLDHTILAEGESTGHKHELVNAILYHLNRWSRKLIFEVPKGMIAKLIHPEHKPQMFPEGFYEVTTQREYSERGAFDVRD